MNKITLIFIALLISNQSRSQKNTLISYELASGKDYVRFNSDTDQCIRNTSTGIPMIILAQEISQHFYIETGVSADYMEFIIGRKSENDGITFHRNDIQIPLRIQYREDLFNKKLHIYLTSGINCSIGAKERNLKVSNDSFGITEFQMKKNYLLGQLGIGVEYLINRSIFAGIRYQYDIGFDDNIKISGYTESNLPFSLSSKGNSSVFGIYFGYRLSNLWNKK